MKKHLIFLATFIISISAFGQNILTPEKLLSLGRINDCSLSADGKTLVGGTKDNKINIWEISP